MIADVGSVIAITSNLLRQFVLQTDTVRNVTYFSLHDGRSRTLSRSLRAQINGLRSTVTECFSLSAYIAVCGHASV